MWVAESQLSAFLMAAGLRANPPADLQNLLDLSGMLLAAQDDFEQSVGIVPFVATKQARVFDPPGPTQASGTVLAGLAAGINTKGGGLAGAKVLTGGAGYATNTTLAATITGGLSQLSTTTVNAAGYATTGSSGAGSRCAGSS